MSSLTNNTSVIPELIISSGSISVYILNDALTFDILFIFFCIIFAVACFGMITCVINASIFFRLGFKDTVNISLFALAITDMCTLLPLVWIGVLSAPRFMPADVDFIGVDVQALTGSWPHTCFARIASWITAYIMIERCLCIVAPMKVKILLSPGRVKCVLVVIVVLNIAGVIPTYCTYGLGWKFVAAYNRTLLGFKVSDNALEVTHISHLLNNPVSAISSFVITLSCMFVIAEKLNQKQKWRMKSTGIGTKTGFTNKDRKAVKMITIVSVVFLISVTPSVCLNIVNILDVQFSLHGSHRNILYVSYSLSYLMEAINASSNIAIYYTRNSRYRKTFKSIFSRVMFVQYL